MWPVVVRRLAAVALLLFCVFLGSHIGAQRVEAGAFAPSQSSWTVVTKSANESRASNTTVTADSELTFAVAANTKYRFRAVACVNSHSTPDIDVRISCPASPTLIEYSCSLPSATNSSLSYHVTGGNVQVGGGFGTDNETVIVFDGILHNGSNAGNVAVSWSQLVSNATASIMRAGSYIEYKAVP